MEWQIIRGGLVDGGSGWGAAAAFDNYDDPISTYRGARLLWFLRPKRVTLGDLMLLVAAKRS